MCNHIVIFKSIKAQLEIVSVWTCALANSVIKNVATESSEEANTLSNCAMLGSSWPSYVIYDLVIKNNWHKRFIKRCNGVENRFNLTLLRYNGSI